MNDDVVIRYLRLRYLPEARACVKHEDGVLAVASVRPVSGWALLLLCDMGRRDPSLPELDAPAWDRCLHAGHRWLVQGFDVALGDTTVLVWDRSGQFREAAPGSLCSASVSLPAVWQSPAGRAVIDKAQAVMGGEWAGAEG